MIHDQRRRHAAGESSSNDAVDAGVLRLMAFLP